jgi:hypothetical protein
VKRLSDKPGLTAYIGPLAQVQVMLSEAQRPPLPAASAFASAQMHLREAMDKLKLAAEEGWEP